MRLFDECERTDDGPIAPGETFPSMLNRSPAPQFVEARKLLEQWFRDYVQGATEREAKRFRGEFESKNLSKHLGAVFELLVHQILVRSRFSVSMHPTVPGTSKRPDFAATSNGSRILVEATVVAPDSNPRSLPNKKEDALRKFNKHPITDYIVQIEESNGCLKRDLPYKEIKRAFNKLLAEHASDPRLFHKILFDDWELSVELIPFAGTGINRVLPWPVDIEGHSSVKAAQRKIKYKGSGYREIENTLILAVNVLPLDFNPVTDAHTTLFGKDGIWHPRRPRCSPVTGVLFFANTDAFNVRTARPCLFVNPSVSPDALPPVLLRLPHCKGPGGSERVEGESVASILGIG